MQAHIDVGFMRKKVAGKLLLIGLSLGIFQTLALPAHAAPLESGGSKKVITHDVYANWKGINGSVLSRDGKWVAYAIVAQEADGEVVIRQLSTAQEWRSPRGTAPSFSADGRFVAFAVQPTRAELDKAKKDKKKADELPKPGLGIMDLSNGKLQTIERVKRFAWPEEGGNYLAVLLEPKEVKKDGQKGDTKKDDTKKDTSLGELSGEFDADQHVGSSGAVAAKKEVGSGFMLIDVTNDQRKSFNDVSQFNWTKNGTWLAFTVVQNEASKESKKDGNKESKAEAKNEVTESSKKENAEVNKESNSEKNLNQTNKPIVDKTTAASAEKLGVAQVPKTTEQATEDVKIFTEGVYVINPAKGEPQALLRGRAAYKQLQFDEAGQQLAFVTDQPDQLRKTAFAESAKKALNEKSESKADEKAGVKTDAKKDTKSDSEDKTPAVFSLFLWQAGEANARAIVHHETAGMRKNWAPSEFGALQFSKDGKRLFFGTAEMQKAEPKDAPEPVKVDLWHWKDPELQSVQKVKAEKEKQRSYRAAAHLGQQPEQARFVQLGTPELPQVLVNENATVALGVSDLAYRQLLSWDSLYYDAYAIDLETGRAQLLVKKLRFPPSMSPAGKYVFAFDAPSSQWLAWRTNDGEKINLTAKLTSKLLTHFEDRSRDTPEPRSAYGSAGWTKDDASIILYDQFDLWEVSPTNVSAARNVTVGFGRKNNLELRYIDLDPEKRVPSEEPQAAVETKALPSEQWLLAATHEDNRSTGFYSVQTAGGIPKKLIHADKQLAGVIKAKNADVLVFTQQSFVEFPDLWTSNLSFAAPQKISAANPQQAQFNWGTQEIIEYTNGDGKKLKALLAKPENFDPSKKYPMMVYIYEKMSDNLHRHVVPSPAQNINVTRYLSNGYIVLRPDIVYTTGYPGRSALKAVVPAAQKVIGMGFVDPKRVGIQGHSWGAYQINYILTKTTMFRAAEAGASMANMVSGYGGIRWGTGLSRAFQYERGQSRIGGTPWGNTNLYLENSPIFSIDKVQTPYLTIHNDDDDAVPWYQAIEFFTALRHLGKEAYWFNYNGEKHGLRERDYMKHFTVHMAEFFDHYLLGSPRAEWMDKPIPYLERGKRDVMGQFKAKEEKVSVKE